MLTPVDQVEIVKLLIEHAEKEDGLIEDEQGSILSAKQKLEEQREREYEERKFKYGQERALSRLSHRMLRILQEDQEETQQKEEPTKLSKKQKKKLEAEIEQDEDSMAEFFSSKYAQEPKPVKPKKSTLIEQIVSAEPDDDRDLQSYSNNVDYLLEECEPGSDSYTALHLAAKYGSLEVVNELLKHTTPSVLAGRNNVSPLSLAVKANKIEVVKALLADIRIDVNTVVGTGRRYTPLMIAIAEGHEELCHILFKDPRVKFYVERTHMGRWRAPHVERRVVQVLQQEEWHFAHYAGGQSSDQNLLHVAVEANNPRMVQMILYYMLERMKKELNMIPLDEQILLGADSRGFTPIDIAVKENYHTIQKIIFKYLKDRKSDFSLKLRQYRFESDSHQFERILFNAIRTDDLPMVKRLFKLIGLRRFDMISSKYSMWTPMQAAVKNGKLRILDFLLKQELNGTRLELGLDSINRKTCLHLASGKGHHDITLRLLEESRILQNIDALDFLGRSALYFACMNNNAGLVNILLQAGADPNAHDSQTNCPPLFIAARLGNLEMVNYLLAKNADMNYIVPKYEKSILHYLVRFDGAEFVEIAKVLLARNGAMINRISHTRNTALHIAVKHGCINMVRVLVETYHADPNIVNVLDMPPVFYCFTRKLISQETRMQIFDVLLASGTLNVNLKMRSAISLLHRLAEVGDLPRTKLLVSKHNAVVHNMTYRRWTPLHIAVKYNHPNVAEYLLQHGAMINFCNNNGSAALHIAIRCTHFGIVSMLMRYGADVNQHDEAIGWTPLHEAAKHLMSGVAENMVDAGALLHTTSYHQYAPVHVASHKYAISTRHLTSGRQLVRLLLQHKSMPADQRKSIILTPYRYGTTLLHEAFGSFNSHFNISTLLKYASEEALKTATVFQKIKILRSILNVRETTKGEWTVTHVAVYRDQKESIQTMVSFVNGVFQDSEDKANSLIREIVNEKTTGSLFTPLMMAVWDNTKFGGTKTYNQELAEDLIALGADVNACDSMGRNVAHFVCMNPLLTMDQMKFLLKNGVDLRQSDIRGITPFYMLVMNGHLDIAKYVLKMGVVNINEPVDDDGCTLAHIVARRGKKKDMKKLIALGISLNITDSSGKLPLHHATLKLREFLVKKANHKGLKALYMKELSKKEDPRKLRKNIKRRNINVHGFI
jgi:ankyrin repeat protein